MRTRPGHFCWCCGRMRPNERFSGAGHARHLCKECKKLGAEELTYRQAVRDIEGMIQWETGRVKRKQRNNFARFLRHPGERIRGYAEGVAARDTAPDVDDYFNGREAFELVWEEFELMWEEEEGRGAG